MAEHDMPRRRAWAAFLVVSLYLIAICLYRVVIPANGLPAPSSTYWIIALDVVLVVVLLTSRHLLGDIPPEDERRRWMNTIFGLALAAGIVIFLIRFWGDHHAFWSGHLRYQLRL